MKTKLPVAILILLGLLGVGMWQGVKIALRSSNTSPASRPTIATNLPAHDGAQVRQSFFSAANDLAAAKKQADQNAALELLRQYLTNSVPSERSAAIRRLLDSKTDAATGLSFKVGKDGFLTEAPTLRTFLLDELAKTDPAAAAAYAREILASSSSPDEWALALRNLAQGDSSTDARLLLESKTAELLRNQAWQQDPSVGYLEAFDAAVFLGGTNLVPTLSDLLRLKDNQAVAHAAFLALDRLSFNDPADVLAALEQNPAWLQGREDTRADYFARADVSDPAQRVILETYLLNPARAPEELTAFAGVFPNANFMISQNLLTQNGTLNGTALRQRDQISLQVVGQWLADPRFANLQQPLLKLQQRLQQFVKTQN